MGNPWTPQFGSSSSSSFSSTKPSSSGIAENTNNEGTYSETGSTHSRRLDEVFPDGQIPPTPNLRTFTFAELKAATSNFRPDTVLGKGRCGTVFKGWINKNTFAPTEAGYGMAIAVKKWNLGCRDEWRSEVEILGSLSHPNIVKLLGHCEEGKELLLVYEFMPRGSLEDHLFSRGSAFQSLSWSIRLKIAIGVARGLGFLHCSERKIIHRNLAPYNVLIDSNYDAKISGFGRARIGPPQGIDYMAPELYLTVGNLYMESDVYCFGVVLLEMLSGMRSVDRPSGQQNLVGWAKPYLSDWTEVSRVMDRRLEGQYPFSGALKAAQLILECLTSEPKNMTEVVEALVRIQAIKA